MTIIFVNSNLHISEQPALALSQWLIQLWHKHLADHSGFHLAISGGQSPVALFQHLAQRPDLPWSTLWLYWCDERCVAADHPESNYGLAQEYLLRHVALKPEQIFRMHGEAPPEVEAERYAQILKAHLPQKPSHPSFDLVLLGLGPDGHTASLFPGQTSALNSKQACVATQNPLNGQGRLSLTPYIINQAQNVAFLLTGASKAEVLSHIFTRSSENLNYPAQFIRPSQLDWFLDSDAARLL
jgi:6-phosphogluconolactonase